MIASSPLSLVALEVQVKRKKVMLRVLFGKYSHPKHWRFIARHVLNSREFAPLFSCDASDCDRNHAFLFNGICSRHVLPVVDFNSLLWHVHKKKEVIYYEHGRSLTITEKQCIAILRQLNGF